MMAKTTLVVAVFVGLCAGSWATCSTYRVIGLTWSWSLSAIQAMPDKRRDTLLVVIADVTIGYSGRCDICVGGRQIGHLGCD